VLYENTENTVLLHQETDFIKNYVELMRIRLTENVDVKMNINIAGYENAGIAPMLFISLVENAFKHGISPNQRSFIHMSFDINSKNTLTCSIQNSFFPKEDSDMTGSGIGIENLRRRLELLFPENHEFHTGELDGIYYSKIVIPLQIIEKL
jgi:LytS/YehU family sensor histidine kinase